MDYQSAVERQVQREQRRYFERWRPPYNDYLLIRYVGGPKDGDKAVVCHPPREVKAVKLPELTATFTDDDPSPSSPFFEIVTYRITFRYFDDLGFSVWEYRTPDRFNDPGVFVW